MRPHTAPSSMPGFSGPAPLRASGGSQTGTRRLVHPLQTRCFLPCGPSGGVHMEAPGRLLHPSPKGRP